VARHETAVEYLTQRLESLRESSGAPVPSSPVLVPVLPHSQPTALIRAHSRESLASDMGGYKTAEEEPDEEACSPPAVFADSSVESAPEPSSYVDSAPMTESTWSCVSVPLESIPLPEKVEDAADEGLERFEGSLSTSHRTLADQTLACESGSTSLSGSSALEIDGSSVLADSGLAPAADKAALLARADLLYDERDYESAHQFLRGQPEAADSGAQCEISWRLSRACRELSVQAKKQGNAAVERSYVGEALSHAATALALDPDNFAAHKWYAISLSLSSSFEGTKAVIQKSFTIKEHFEAAVRLGSHDPTSRHLLGIWYFEVASLSWTKRKLAAAIYASPPSGSHLDALEHFSAAESLAPGFYVNNRLMLAKCHLALKDKRAAEEWLHRTLDLDAKSEEEAEALAEARELLKSV